ncbi:MAG: tryptophan--tRNA ligase [Nitrospinae bacterium]|nr:tryptophan--tRNA ligase [Nitrospinota bacterium]
METKKRVLSGMQASGRLHLGNLLGALTKWKELQDGYECFYFIADWHALSTCYEDTHEIKGNTFEIAVDWLSVGIDPEKSTIFIQSLVPEHAILHLLLSMITPIPWLERNPTYKEKQMEIKDRDLTTYGFLGYPVLQTADIVLYKANCVPVGIDQLPHLELTREIVRRFNYIYRRGVFVEPDAILSETPKLPGTDGRKMSKSYNNAIYLSDPPEEIEKKVRSMLTDPQRVRRTDPGDPEVCPVFALHKIYSPTPSHISEISDQCRRAKIGCVDCKMILVRNLIKEIRPIYERRCELRSNPEGIYEILIEGSKKARRIAIATLKEATEAMGMG